MTLIIAELLLYLFSGIFVIKFLNDWLRTNDTIITAFIDTFVPTLRYSIINYIVKIFEYTILILCYAYIMSNR